VEIRVIKGCFQPFIKQKGSRPGPPVEAIFIETLGLIVALLIMFYVVDEWSFDRYNVKADRIYRINTDVKFGSDIQSFAQGSPAIEN